MDPQTQDPTTPASPGPDYGDVTPAVPGNIQWYDRPRVSMPGPPGQYGTVYSSSREENGKEVLYPQIYDGAYHSDADAWQHYKQTGQHMGKFNNVADADAFAQKYHEDAAAGKYDTPPVSKAPVNTSNMIHMVSPEGDPYQIPAANLSAARSRGLKPTVQMTSPEGDLYYIPQDKAAEAVQKRGFTVGKKSYADLPSPTQAAMKGVQNGLSTTVQGLKDGVTGALQSVNPVQQTGENAITQIPAVRMIKGVVGALSGAPQIPGAISDINHGPNPLQSYADVANSSASQALPGLLASEVGDTGSTPNRMVRTAGKVGQAALEDLPVVKQLMKTGKYYKETAPVEAAKPPVITDPAAINAKVQDLIKAGKPAPPEPEQGTLPLVMGHIEGAGDTSSAPAPPTPEPTPTPKPAPQTVGSTSGAANDTALFQRAKTELGPDAPIGKVAQRAQQFKQQGANFEKTFGADLSDYQDASGKFDMKGFLQDIVKPKTEPPAYVISKVFGSDGVNLIQDISGKPIEKWESTGPSKAERSLAKVPANGYTEGSKVVSGSPDQYLRLVGADEKSVVKGPEDEATVNHFQQQLRTGKPLDPPELHLDEGNQVIGADGRHRAVAAVREGIGKMKVKVVRHAFESAK